jgi:hypothetical protein
VRLRKAPSELGQRLESAQLGGAVEAVHCCQKPTASGMSCTNDRILCAFQGIYPRIPGFEPPAPGG